MAVSNSAGMSCDNSLEAGLQGTVMGMLNLVGVGSLLEGSSGFDAQTKADKALEEASDSLNDAVATWSTAITDMKFQIVEDQIDNLQMLIKAASSQQSLINETLSQKINSNSLMISMVVILVIFLVLYDIV